MKPQKAELDALREVLMTPLAEFVTDKERAEKGEEKSEVLAQTRMFTRALEAAELARGQRTTYTVVLRHGSGSSTTYTAFGPYATSAQAGKAYEQTIGPAMEHTAVALVPTRNEHYLPAVLAEVDENPMKKGDWAVIRDDARAFKNGWKGKAAVRERFLT